MEILLTNNKRLKARQRGFTLLLASLIASLLLAIGLSMFTIAQKEIILSSLGRDSQYAFYAADAGAECALYWDLKGGFATDSPVTGAKCNTLPIGEPAGCTTDTCELGGNDYVLGEATSNFNFEQNGKCINVTVTKFESGDTTTEINSRGYSVGCDNLGSPILTARSLERAVRMRY